LVLRSTVTRKLSVSFVRFFRCAASPTAARYLAFASPGTSTSSLVRLRMHAADQLNISFSFIFTLSCASVLLRVRLDASFAYNRAMRALPYGRLPAHSRQLQLLVHQVSPGVVNRAIGPLRASMGHTDTVDEAVHAHAQAPSASSCTPGPNPYLCSSTLAALSACLPGRTGGQSELTDGCRERLPVRIAVSLTRRHVMRQYIVSWLSGTHCPLAR
jgi:hypothetical protein